MHLIMLRHFLSFLVFWVFFVCLLKKHVRLCQMFFCINWDDYNLVYSVVIGWNVLYVSVTSSRCTLLLVCYTFHDNTTNWMAQWTHIYCLIISKVRIPRISLRSLPYLLAIFAGIISVFGLKKHHSNLCLSHRHGVFCVCVSVSKFFFLKAQAIMGQGCTLHQYNLILP